VQTPLTITVVCCAQHFGIGTVHWLKTAPLGVLALRQQRRDTRLRHHRVGRGPLFVYSDSPAGVRGLPTPAVVRLGSDADAMNGARRCAAAGVGDGVLR